MRSLHDEIIKKQGELDKLQKRLAGEGVATWHQRGLQGTIKRQKKKLAPSEQRQRVDVCDIIERGGGQEAALAQFLTRHGLDASPARGPLAAAGIRTTDALARAAAAGELPTAMGEGRRPSPRRESVEGRGAARVAGLMGALDELQQQEGGREPDSTQRR
eukprot:gene22420-54597_t